MAMIITSIAEIKKSSTEEGFKLFCRENNIDPLNYKEPWEGVCVDKMDLYRYGAAEAARELAQSVAAFKHDCGMTS